MELLQKAKVKNRITAVVGLSISVALIIYFSDLVNLIIHFTEKYLSPDHHLDTSEIISFKGLFSMLILFIILFSLFFLLNIFQKIRQFTDVFIDRNSVIKFFFNDDICTIKQLPVILFIIATFLSICLHFYFLLFGQPMPEGPIEKYSSLMFLFSAILLVISSIKLNQNLFSKVAQKRVIFSLIVISGILLFIFGEEISWGQRIFGWDSFGVFKEYNLQDETNVHNFFDPLFIYIYPTVGLSSFLVMLFLWFFPTKKRTFLFHLFIPHPSLFFLLFFMAGSSFYGHSEIYEELLSIFVFLYGIRLVTCLSFPEKELFLNET